MITLNKDKQGDYIIDLGLDSEVKVSRLYKLKFKLIEESLIEELNDWFISGRVAEPYVYSQEEIDEKKIALFQRTFDAAIEHLIIKQENSSNMNSLGKLKKKVVENAKNDKYKESKKTKILKDYEIIESPESELIIVELGEYLINNRMEDDIEKTTRSLHRLKFINGEFTKESLDIISSEFGI